MCRQHLSQGSDSTIFSLVLHVCFSSQSKTQPRSQLRFLSNPQSDLVIMGATTKSKCEQKTQGSWSMTCPLKLFIFGYHAHIWRMDRGKLRCLWQGIRCTQLRYSLQSTRQSITQPGMKNNSNGTSHNVPLLFYIRDVKIMNSKLDTVRSCKRFDGYRKRSSISLLHKP